MLATVYPFYFERKV